MDNNFNQNNQNMGQDMNQTQNQYQPQYDTVQGNGAGVYQTQTTTNYAAGTVPKKPNIVLGSLGALIAAVLGVVVWILIAVSTGSVFFFVGVLIAALAIFLYEKLAKGIDIVGFIICIALTCIAIYIGNKYGYLCWIAHDEDVTMDQAKLLFDISYAWDDTFQMEYIKNMIFSYIVGVGYSIAMIVNKVKKSR